MSMQEFKSHTGIAVPMLWPNIDTDAIIPSREMKQVTRSGLGMGLFAGWRYLDRGTSNEKLNPDFILNEPQFRGASIILAGPNFGCGSSREFAVWALVDYGIRAIIAPSFGSIFRTNCIRNNLLPVTLDETIIEELSRQIEPDPQARQVTIDLMNQQVRAPDGHTHPFEIDAIDRKMLIDGVDLIDLTLKSNDKIEQFESNYQSRRPWSLL